MSYDPVRSFFTALVFQLHLLYLWGSFIEQVGGVTPLYELSDTNEILMVDEGEDMNIVDGHGRRAERQTDVYSGRKEEKLTP